MSNINYIKGLFMKKENFSPEDDKCNILAMWGVYIEQPYIHTEPNESESESESESDTYWLRRLSESSNIDNYICHHSIDDIGYIDVYRIGNKSISWCDDSLEDIKLKWVDDLRVYMSINESLYDDKIWVKVLSIN